MGICPGGHFREPRFFFGRREAVWQTGLRRLPPRVHSMASAESALQRIGRGGARAAQETPAATAPLAQPRGFGAGDPFTEPTSVRRFLPAPGEAPCSIG